MCTPWGAVGYPSIDLRWGRARLLRCVAMKTTRLLVLTLVLTLSAAIASGCGSSSGSGGDDDPAALIPAGAPLYVEGVVRPDGQVRSDLEGALKKILRTDDPGAKIQQLIDESGKSDDITFKDDVEPWVGNRVGFAVTALHNGRNADYAAVIDSKDDGKAEQAAGQAEGHRQALLQGHRLPLRRQGEDGDRAHRPPRRGRHRGRAEGRSSTPSARTTSTRPTA